MSNFNIEQFLDLSTYATDEETGITRDEIRKHIEELLPDYYSIRK